jgi:hypothetical protein
LKIRPRGAEDGRLPRLGMRNPKPRTKEISFVGSGTTTISIAWSYWAGSIPRGAGEASARIVLSNAGDHLHIAKPNAAVSAR